MLTLNPHTTALVLIDLQKGILDFAQAPHTAEAVLRNAASLSSRFRELGAPVFRGQGGVQRGAGGYGAFSHRCRRALAGGRFARGLAGQP